MSRETTPQQHGDDVPILEARGITKNFGGTQALKGVSIGFQRGEVHAVVGENGAGKSTLVKILCGVYATDKSGGELLLDGHPIHVDNIHAAESHGIFLVPQDLQIVPELSIAENLYLNREPTRLGMVQPSRMLPEAAAWLRDFQLDTDPAARMGTLMPAQQQLVVIARAMMRGVRILALDEPTATLTDSEIHVLFGHVDQLRRRGIAVLYISHRLDEIIRIADRVTVLRDGLVADRLEPGEARQTAQRIVHAMVGRDVDLSRRERQPAGEARLVVEGLTVTGNQGGARRPRLRNFSLEVRAGEVVGVFGSVGCGADDFVRALIGASELRVEGQISVDGRDVRISHPIDAIRVGIGYLPGDRHRDAVFSLLSVAQNIGILVLDRMSVGGIVVPEREIPLVHDFYARFRIKATTVDDCISVLSGGNQQKVMLARVLSRDPTILILHEPTQGVDIATKQEFYGVIDHLAKAGKAILVVSSDLEEVLITSDRIEVLRLGKSVGSWDGATVTQHEILAAATGGT